jgi:hypothetical protein
MRYDVILSAPSVILSAAKDLLVLACVANVANAQSLENRVAAVRGSVVFTYTTRPNVCGTGGSIYISDDTSTGWNLRSRRSGVHIGTRRGGSQERCDIGPAQVLLRRDDGRVADLRVWVGGRSETGDTHLGDVPPADAARYLLALAPRLTGKSADDAILGAQIADDVVTWPTLLQIARDNGASESARKSAVFWVSHEASVAATRGLDSIAVDDDVTLSVRKDALFFLAQRPGGEGIPALLRVAETSKSRALRKDAIWFLAQSRDSRALELFERLLSGR